jgi:ABC-type spermidine/putrescine transport system permease subunit II
MDRAALNMRVWTVIVQWVLLAAALLFVVLPTGVTGFGAFASPLSPGGFGLDRVAIARLAGNTLAMSLGGALIGLSLCVAASAVGLASHGFRRAYRAWLAAMLFTNPIFLVLGLSTLLAEWPPLLATTVATGVIVTPLGGLIVEGAFAEFPRAQIEAARSLGSGTREILRLHVLPSIAGQAEVAGLLMAIYAMGFYLLPAYVGLGRTPTLATAISTLVTQLGDWAAAQQLAVILIGIELVVLALWWLASRSRRSWEATDARA